MSTYAFIPPINPIRFVEKDYSFSDEFGHKPYGLAGFTDSLTNQEVDEPYFQPFKKSGEITLQFVRGIVDGGTNETKIKFYSEQAALLLTINVNHDFFLTLSGNTDPDTDEQLHALKAYFSPSQYSQLNDYDLVWIELELNYDGTYRRFRSSAPIYLFTDNEGFVKIQYTNDTNDYGCYWENRNQSFYPVFQLYVEADRMKKVSASERLTYEDMNQKLEKLYSKAYDKYTFNVGGNSQGVPDYMIDIVDRALMCDNVSIDGRAYRFEEAGESSGNSPLQTKEYTLREADENSKYTYKGTQVTLWERPASGYPYAVGNITLQDLGGRVIRLDARILTNSGDETALLSILDARAVLNNSTGTFSESSGTFIFTNGQNESFGLVSDVQVLTKKVDIVVNVGTSSGIYRHTVTFPNNFDAYYHIVNFGESTNISFDTLYTSNAGAINASYTYITTGNYTISVFHKDLDTVFNINNTVSTQPKITNVTGVFSSTLRRIYLRNHDFSALASLDLAFIAPAKDTLDTLVITGSNLQAITAGWASGLVVGIPPNWYRPFYNIGFIDLSRNSLDTAGVDAFCNELHGSTRWQGGLKSLALNYQSPLAPPTGSSLTARNAFIAAGWTVFTD